MGACFRRHRAGSVVAIAAALVVTACAIRTWAADDGAIASNPTDSRKAMVLPNAEPGDIDWPETDVVVIPADSLANVLPATVLPRVERPEPELFSDGGLRASDCCPVGGYVGVFPLSNYFQGNVLGVNTNGILSEFKAELDFTGSVALTYGVYKLNRGTGLYDPIEIRQVIHNGQGRGFYSSGLMNIALTIDGTPQQPLEGRYALGVGWADDVVNFARDADASFCLGTVVGWWGRSGNPPPVGSQTSLSLAPSSGIASSMDVCFQAVGGSCCLDDASCIDDVTAEACEVDNLGQYNGDFSVCALETCEGRGACCLGGAGTCETKTEAECTAALGTYHGDGTQCGSPDPCDTINVGACCYYDGSCAVVTEYACEHDPSLDTPGTFTAPGVTCASAACEDLGACCTSFDACTDEIAENCIEFLCQDMATTGAPCAPGYDVDSVGLCPDTMNPGECIQFTGLTWNEGEPCVHNACFGRVGACCLLGECSVESELLCENKGGVFNYVGDDGWRACEIVGEGFCDSTTNGADLGACCLPGGCELMDSNGCANSNGLFQGEGAACSDFLCSEGACCYFDAGLGEDSCTNALPVTCASPSGYNGFYQGIGTTCPANCYPNGACCLPDGSCTEDIRESDCLAADGLYMGDSTTCAAVFCPSGACCLPDGSCEDDMTPQACSNGLGEFQGDATTCGLVSCPMPGACCVDFGVTQVCFEETDVECSGRAQPTTFAAGGSCVADACEVGACCELDGSCTAVTGAECSAIPDTLFDSSTNGCGIATCTPRGACCTTTGCVIATEADCLDTNGLNGDYRGDGMSCDSADVCTVAACCTPAPGCVDLYLDECAAANGLSADPGVLCASEPDLCTEGSCCVDFTSTGAYSCLDNLNRLECATFDVDFDAIFAGPGSSCGSDPCSLVTGSCCRLDGDCDADVTEAECDLVGGGTYVAGGTCTPNTCPDTCSTFPGIAPADFNGDGKVDLTDYAAFQSCFGSNPSDACMCVFDVNEDGAITVDPDYNDFITHLTSQTGACCHLDGTCEQLTFGLCSDIGGAVFSAQTACTPSPCVDTCSTFAGLAPGDYDGDGDVDLVDFGALQVCFGVSPTNECMCMFDVDESGVIDTDDFAAFAPLLSGP